MQYFFKNKSYPIFTDGKLPDLVHVCDISDVNHWIRPMHLHENVTEILFIREGEGSFIIGGKAIEGKKGDILISNCGVLHDERSSADHPLVTYVCGINNFQINGLPDNHLIHENMLPMISSDQYSHILKNLFELMINEVLAETPGMEETCQYTLCTLVSLMIRITQNSHDANDGETRLLGLKIKDYIDQNYMKEINLTEIAANLYISPFYLAHVFKKEIGFSPIQYVINRRIGESQNILITTKKPITEIAKMVGYDNPNYFNLLFKKITGMSPGKFRKKHTQTLKSPPAP